MADQKRSRWLALDDEDEEEDVDEVVSRAPPVKKILTPIKNSLFDDSDEEDDDEDEDDEPPLPQRGARGRQKSGQSRAKKEKPAKMVSNRDDRTPRQKFKAFQAYRGFLSREPPRALGSKEIPKGRENCLEGLTFVITGVFESIDRDETKSLIQKHGGKVTTSVCRSTRYLVAGRDCGQSKLDKAAEFGTEMLDEDALFDLIRRLPGKRSKYEIAAEQELRKSMGNQRGQRGQPWQSRGGRGGYGNGNGNGNGSSHHGNDNWGPSSSSKSCGQSSSQPAPPKPQTDSLMWVDRYKPTNIRAVIGQQGEKSCARKLLFWLLNWHKNYGKKPIFGPRVNDDGAGHKAALLSGPPGVGKTTTAQLVCQELGFSYFELNASDTRSKRSLLETIGSALGSRSLSDFYSSKKKKSGAPNESWKHVLIMDEVDGMAGNEDRGGIQVLIQLIKQTKVPIICICNDRTSMKIRSLCNYCFDLRFQRPRVEQIKGAIMTMAFKEGVKIPPSALNDVIVAANQDVRQVIHNLSMWTINDKSLTYEQLKAAATNAKKDLRLGAFDVCRKVFSGGDETPTMGDKIDLFFNDYSILPLFVYENYIAVMPFVARGNMLTHLKCQARAMDGIATGDLVDGLIRRGQNWHLLPTQAVFASVVPGEAMRGAIGQMIQFPQWLGKNSTSSKNHRLIQELVSHVHVSMNASKRALTLDYLPYLRLALSDPLINDGSAAVEPILEKLHSYDLLREDFDTIMELTSWSTSENPLELIDSKVKGAFTRAYNKAACKLPYVTNLMSRKKRKRQAGEGDELEAELEEGLDGGEGGAVVESEPEHSDDDITADSMIKQKKKAKALAKIKQLNDEEETGERSTTSKKKSGDAKTTKSKPQAKKDDVDKGTTSKSKGKDKKDKAKAKDKQPVTGSGSLLAYFKK